MKNRLFLLVVCIMLPIISIAQTSQTNYRNGKRTSSKTKVPNTVSDHNSFVEILAKKIEGRCLKRNIISEVLEGVEKRDSDQVIQPVGWLMDDLCFGEPPSVVIPSANNHTVDSNMVFVEGNNKIPSFYIGKYEVTNGEFCAFLNEKGNQKKGGRAWLEIEATDCKIELLESRYRPKSGYAQHPVVEVSWYGAKAYAKWKEGRLPTEKEWEYAARGGNKSREYEYSGSNTMEEVGNFCDKNCAYSWAEKEKNDGYERTSPIGAFQSNELGLYDMSGNVWEWCSDWHETDKKSKVLRSGSWYVNARYCRVSFRVRYSPVNTYYDTGFRILQDIK